MDALGIHSFLCLLLIEPLNSRILDDYQKIRSNLLEEETMLSLGGRLPLNEAEIKVNDLLMRLKDAEIEESFYDPSKFNFSKHYFTFRNQIQSSKVYQIVKRMPKGAALHIHSTFMLDADFLLELTYEENLYICFVYDHLKLQFAMTAPQRPCPVNWTLLSELRNSTDDIEIFDMNVKRHFSMLSDDLKTNESDINYVWRRFETVYRNIKSLIAYRPVREKFLYESLKRFYDDNVMYLEVRGGLHSLYELDGTTHEPLYMAKLYQEITDTFIKDHPDFIGIKLILTRHRTANLLQLREILDTAKQLKQEIPEMFAGFDLVGQEDLGRPLKDFLPVLTEVKDEMNFYFHGGETNWFGTTSDENLIDAVLLGSKRIGHAYALVKHPTLMTAVKERDIALEVNVISNAVLCLVRDIRNHPLATYLALGLPVVLSSDDPGVWGAEPLSHDFYVSFVAVASKHADLRVLKQLALNSINYSALDDEGKVRLFNVFNKRWNAFLVDIIDYFDL